LCPLYASPNTHDEAGFYLTARLHEYLSERIYQSSHRGQVLIDLGRLEKADIQHVLTGKGDYLLANCESLVGFQGGCVRVGAYK
jgi:hypothetical protein